MRSNPLALLTLVALSTPAASQQVWNIAAGAPIQPIVDGAAPGDVLVLAPGTYEKFNLNKGLTIVGPATLGTNLVVRDLTVAVPAGQHARLIDLTIRPDTPPNGFSNGVTAVTSGVAVFEGCRFEAARGTRYALSVAGASVVLDHCNVIGSGVMTFAPVALLATDAHVAATDTHFVGAHGVAFTPPGRAIEITGSGSLHLSACTASGGDAGGIIAEAPAQPAIATGVPTWLTDCIVTGGSNPFFGVPASGLVAGVPSETARCTIVAGTGLVLGTPTSGPVTVNPELLGAQSSGPATLGGAFSVTFSADRAGVGVTVLATAAGPSAPIAVPVVAQPLWATSLFVAGSLATNAGGTATLSLTVPTTPALRYQAFELFGVRLAAVGIQASPLVPVTVL